MALPKNPRQAMINIMYLVLTALLALNISAEVLFAFEKVNDGILGSIAAIDSKNQILISQLENRKQIDPKAVEIYEKVLEVQAISEKLNNRIEQIKSQILYMSGAESIDAKLVSSKLRNTHPSTNLMITNGMGEELQYEINQTRHQLLSFYYEEDLAWARETISLLAADPSSDGQVNKTWSEDLFEEMPAIASLTILSSLQNDLKSSESSLIDYLIEQLYKFDFVVDKFQAKAIPDARIVNVGESVGIDFIVTAYNTRLKPKAYLGKLDIDAKENIGQEMKDLSKPPMQEVNDIIEIGSDGLLHLEQDALSTGDTQVEGVIEIIHPESGEPVYYPFEAGYKVIAPVAVISIDKMNMLYAGIDHEISVSVPGYPNDRVSTRLVGGASLSSLGNGNYQIRSNMPGQVKVDVYVRNNDNEIQRVKSMPFRIRRLPRPDLNVGGFYGPSITKGALRAAVGMIGNPEGFQFQVNYRIMEFDVYYQRHGESQILYAHNNGRIFEDNVKRLFSNPRLRDKVRFENVKVKLPDGTTRTESLSLVVIE